MRKLAAYLLIFLLLTMCASAEEHTLTDAYSLLNGILDKADTLIEGQITDYDENTDPNQLMGTVGGYFSKSDFVCHDCKDKFGQPDGGTLEVFNDTLSSRNRFEYVKAIYISAPIFSEYRIYLFGPYNLRIANDLENEKAIELAALIISDSGYPLEDVFDSKQEQTLETFENIVPITDNPTHSGITIPVQIAPSMSIPAPTEDNSSPEIIYSALQRGDKGEEVVRLQKALIALGYLDDTADGSFGPKTEKAVAEYQIAKGLQVTKIADNPTLQLLYAEYSE